MEFDKWFDEQDRLVKIILLIIPIVGWFIEILVRISALIRKTSTTNIVGFILFCLLGEFWIPTIIDLIYFILYDKLILME